MRWIWFSQLISIGGAILKSHFETSENRATIPRAIYRNFLIFLPLTAIFVTKFLLSFIYYVLSSKDARWRSLFPPVPTIFFSYSTISHTNVMFIYYWRGKKNVNKVLNNQPEFFLYRPITWPYSKLRNTPNRHDNYDWHNFWLLRMRINYLVRVSSQVLFSLSSNQNNRAEWINKKKNVRKGIYVT